MTFVWNLNEAIIQISELTISGFFSDRSLSVYAIEQMDDLEVKEEGKSGRHCFKFLTPHFWSWRFRVNHNMSETPN